MSGPPTRSAWLRGALLGLGLIPTAMLPRARSEEPSRPPAASVVTVEQRADQLERLNREHQAEMKKRLDHFDELSSRTASPAAKTDDRARRAADDENQG